MNNYAKVYMCIAGVVALLVMVSFRLHLTDIMLLFGGDWRCNDEFRDVNALGVFTFRNVCLEINTTPMRRTMHFINSKKSFVETLRIVVYDATNNSKDSISVSGSGNTMWNFWDVTYNTSRIPNEYAYQTDVAAYFLAFTCPGNLHHFLEDEFRTLQSLVSVTNRLRSGCRNRLLYRAPWDLDPSEMDCYDVRTYEPLLALLNFDHEHDAYYRMPANTCFRYGVFGNADFSGGKRQASDYVIGKLGIDYDRCELDVVTVIRRRTRRILNADVLINVTVSEGFGRVREVAMEDLSVEEQIRTIACTTILVGVQGAGLQWAVFMRPGSTLIEIAWPEKHWRFYFKGYITPYNIYHRGVLAKHVRINWRVYQDKVRGGEVVSSRERAILMRSAPKNMALDNVWKWADAVVNVEHYRAALRSHKYANMILRH
ncbi:hypothetical protein LSH36_404g01023 [Paralvinella palmiformis]|uniref:Glycosyltransferase 61 catalytic domain-containing protein n=1 Tax=Paralvinella palmiformis TaxID=53620 RepID=A0AAD9JD73_9ANNE|nr:hypothetical protein LSH36_404g01023 [Paralvinella palmiformis]